MNKHDLVKAIIDRTDLSSTEAAAALDAVLDAVIAALADGDRVTIASFGTFETRQRSARVGRNPQTGEPLKIPASVTPAFKPAAALKAALKQAVSG